MAISSIDQAISASKVRLPFCLASIANMTAGLQASLWKAPGPYPPAAANPSSAVVPTDADSGLIFTNPTNPVKTYLYSLDVMASQIGQLILYDRLSHLGGLSGTTTTAQTFTTAAINRGDTSGLNVEAFLEWYTDTGGTGTTCTCSYTDHAGNAGATTGSITISATQRASTMRPFILAAGDFGVRAVANVDLVASTTVAGNFGVTLCRRLATVPVNIVNSPIKLGPLELGMPLVDDDACLFWSFIPSSTSTGQFTGEIVLAQG